MFDALVNLFYENVSNNYSKYGCTFTQVPIKAEIAVAIGLCWLDRGSYIDLNKAYSCSVSSIYAHRLCFIHVVNSCEHLKQHFTRKPAEISAS